ncbi:hypothetical protein Efla_006039 [Eimeria flavescens]
MVWGDPQTPLAAPGAPGAPRLRRAPRLLWKARCRRRCVQQRTLVWCSRRPSSRSDAVGDAQRGGAQERSIHEQDLNLSGPIAEGHNDGGCERHPRIPSHLTISEGPEAAGASKASPPKEPGLQEWTKPSSCSSCLPAAAAAAAAAARRGFRSSPACTGAPESFALCMQRARKVEHQGQQRHIEEHSGVDAELKGTRGPGRQEGGRALAPSLGGSGCSPPQRPLQIASPGATHHAATAAAAGAGEEVRPSG